jgi:hypothetical protein
VAKGEWIMFIGADDILLPYAIDNYIDLLREITISDCDYISSYNEYFSEDGRLLKILGTSAEWQSMRRGMSASHVGSLHSKALFADVGLYDLKFSICADYELLLRKGNKLRWYLNKSMVVRMQAGGMSFTKNAIKEAFEIRKVHTTVSPLVNRFLYYRDLIMFSFFKLRKGIR